MLTALLLGNTPPPSPGGWIWLDPLGKDSAPLHQPALRRLRLLCGRLSFLPSGALQPGPLHGAAGLPVGHEPGDHDPAPGTPLGRPGNHHRLAWRRSSISISNARSIEATWKYLLLCSVGIGLALLGLLFLAYSTYVAHHDATLLLGPLMASARELNPAWLHAAAIFLLVGYGSKMGLAPLHAWKPDAYGEAPGLVGALLAGGLVNCAFLVDPAGLPDLPGIRDRDSVFPDRLWSAWG